jgi:hypothetical protein
MRWHEWQRWQLYTRFRRKRWWKDINCEDLAVDGRKILQDENVHALDCTEMIKIVLHVTARALTSAGQQIQEWCQKEQWYIRSLLQFFWFEVITRNDIPINIVTTMYCNDDVPINTVTIVYYNNDVPINIVTMYCNNDVPINIVTMYCNNDVPINTVTTVLQQWFPFTLFQIRSSNNPASLCCITCSDNEVGRRICLF